MNGRYVCGAEAAYRIFGFDVHHRTISVERLPVHLPNEKPITFRETDNIQWDYWTTGLRLGKFEAFFQLNQSN